VKRLLALVGEQDAEAEQVATEVNAEGYREILSLQVTPADDGASWLEFFRNLTARGLTGVALVTANAHQGLTSAIGAMTAWAAWIAKAVLPTPARPAIADTTGPPPADTTGPPPAAESSRPAIWPSSATRPVKPTVNASS
jgi:hypothetical protein